jgi:DNA-binding response OmpR family regulator
MRILVAEDEADLARTLRKVLTEDGYAVDCTPNGDAALGRPAPRRMTRSS